MNVEVSNIFNDLRDDFISKSELNKKYNVSFSREYELKHYLYGLCIDIRHKSDNYTYSKEDYIIFNIYWNTPCSSKKLLESVKDEPIDFIEFILVFYKKFNERCPHDKRYFTLLKILYKIKNEAIVKKLFDKMIKLTDQYKVNYINNYIDFYMKKMHFYKEYFNKDISDKSDTFKKRYSFMMYDSNNFDEDFYRNKLAIASEKEYVRNIELLVDRMIKKTPDPENIELEYIGEDVIGFEVVLKSNEFKMHIRAIYCAENSDLVSPHLRYICTTKK